MSVPNPSAGVPDELLDSLLRGTDQAPLPESWRRFLAAEVHAPDAEPALALLEAVSVLHYLQESRWPDPAPEAPAAAAVREDDFWSPARLKALRDWLLFPPVLAWPELAALLRRRQTPLPRAAWQIVFDGLERHPDLFPVVADLLPEEARAEAARHPRHHGLFPRQAPDLRRMEQVRGMRQAFHWLWQDAEAALAWLGADPPGADARWWAAFLRDFAHRLPPAATGLLPLLPSKEAWPPDLRYVRALLGDETDRQGTLLILAGLFSMDQGQLRLALPPPGPAWGGRWPEEAGLDRASAFTHLLRGVSPGLLAEALALTPEDLYRLAFRSPEAETLLPALADQLRLYTDPEARLAWWNQRLAWPGKLPVEAREELAMGLPHDRLSALLVRHLPLYRERFDPEGPAARLLAAESLFWSEALTGEVLGALSLHAALAQAWSVHPRLFPALLWRGHLGVWARQLQGARPLGDLPAPLYRRREDILKVIQARIGLHQAFRGAA